MQQFLCKNSHHTRNRRQLSQFVKGHQQKKIHPDIILIGDTVNISYWGWEEGKGVCSHPLYSPLYQMAQPVQWGKSRNKNHKDWKGVKKWPLFTDDNMIVNLENPKERTKKIY